MQGAIAAHGGRYICLIALSGSVGQMGFRPIRRFQLTCNDVPLRALGWLCTRTKYDCSNKKDPTCSTKHKLSRQEERLARETDTGNKNEEGEFCVGYKSRKSECR